MTLPGIDQPLAAFSQQAASVRELLDFDRFVLEHVAGGLERIAEGLEARNFNNDATTVRNRLQSIRNIRDAGSLRPRYETMFNQCIVLLVSYFGSTVGDLFRLAIATALTSQIEVPVAVETVEVDWRTLSQTSESHPHLVARLVVAKQKITFQDMGGIVRAFDKNLGIELERTEPMNDIILAQAARHAIVHAGATVDSHMINQVRAARPRSVKQDLVLASRISFTTDEVTHLAEQMLAFVRLLTADVSRVVVPQE